MVSLNSDVNTTNVQKIEHDNIEVHSEDATWILTSAFIIFTMQSGFGLLEAGLVSRKNETNIMVKNAIDVIYGGLAYWIFGFGITFGDHRYSNSFSGWGDFFFDTADTNMGLFAKYFFQLSFATTATTIVSGAMAERVDIRAYVLFSFLNTISYAFPAHWMWDSKGFLYKMGAVDVAGCGPVHLVGGVAALVAAVMLKPRKSKFDEYGKPKELQMASPTNVLLGIFMLWWGWLGFNCGSTFGTSGDKWKIASRSAVVTINGSVGGGIVGMVYSYIFFKKKIHIGMFVTGILGGLVGISAICAVCRPWEGLVIGAIGGIVATACVSIEEKLHIDDPVGAFPVHAVASIWGLVATGLFCEPTPGFSKESGVFKGGSIKFLAVQILCVFCCTVWAAVTTFLLLFVIDKIIGIRMSAEEEELGADYFVHNIPIMTFNTEKIITSEHAANHQHEGEDNETRTVPSFEICSSSIDGEKLQEINSCQEDPTLARTSYLSETALDNSFSPSSGTGNNGYIE